MTELKIELKPNDQSALSIEVAKKVQEKSLSLSQIFELSGDLSFFDTGFMPQKHTGLINYRRGGGFETFVYQVDAGIHTVLWGDRESSDHVDRLQLAMPYRIIIGDHSLHNGVWHMVGARHFYSPVPIKSWDTPLYNCNLPNLNCQGYSGTGVGWICLYHRKPYSGQSMYERIMSTVQRTSGNEAYNDANMDETDGPRYYDAHGMPAYFWDKESWSKKSASDGYEWTLDPELLLPVKIKDPAKEHMQDNSGTRHASLFDLTRGMYRAYYSDEVAIKPVNIMDQTNPFLKEYNKLDVIATFQHILTLFDSNLLQAHNKKIFDWAPKIEKKKCGVSGKLFPEIDSFYDFYDKDGNKGQAHKSSMKHLKAATMKIRTLNTGDQFLTVKCTQDAVWQDALGRYYHMSLDKGEICPKCNKPEAPKELKYSISTIEEYGSCQMCLDRFNCESCGKEYTIDLRQSRSIDELEAPSVSQKQKNMVIKAVQAGVNMSDIKVEITDSKDATPQTSNICIHCASRPRRRRTCACGLEGQPSSVTVIQGVYSPVCDGCIMVDPKSKVPLYMPKQVNHSYSYSKMKHYSDYVLYPKDTLKKLTEISEF